jgi:hypothetical protein
MNKQHVLSQFPRLPAATLLEHPALRLQGAPKQGQAQVQLLGQLKPGEVIGLSGAAIEQQRLLAAWLSCQASEGAGVLWLTEADPVALRTDCLAIDSGQSRGYVGALLEAMKYGIARGDKLSHLNVAENLFVFRAGDVVAESLRRIAAGFHHCPLRLLVIESLPQGMDLDGLRRLANRIGIAVLWLGADQAVTRRLSLRTEPASHPRGGRSLLQCTLHHGRANQPYRLRMDVHRASCELLG